MSTQGLPIRGRHLGVTGCAAFALLTGLPAGAQSFSLLYAFPNTYTLGADPGPMTMVEGTPGNFYGTTVSGGDTQNVSGGGGTVFSISSSGSLNQLWQFCTQSGCPDGRNPYGGVIKASDGNFYGTTYGGGTYDQGTIFRITPGGSLTTLYSFCWYPNTCPSYSGGSPKGALLQAKNGTLYGTTTAGTAYTISLKGKFKLLYTWPSGGGSDGALIEVGKKLYGTTVTGGASNEGTVFSISTKGKLKTLYSFCAQSGCTDGAQPYAGLVLAPDGYMYGTTFVGGTGVDGGSGTVFKISTRGKFTSLVSFDAKNEPAGPSNPSAQLTLAADGTLYGTSQNGGANSGSTNPGTVFQIANDTLANVYPLPGNTGCVGTGPAGGLLAASDNNLYGSADSSVCGDFGSLFGFGPVTAKQQVIR